MSSITKKKTARLQWITAVLSFITGVILIITTIGDGVHAWVDSLFEGPMAEITTPEGPSVPASFPVSGKFTGIPAGEVLWAIRYKYGDQNWYPLRRPCKQLSRGEFKCGNMTIKPDDSAKNRVYIIAVARVSAGAVSEFDRYYREVVFKDRNHPDYEGMSILPSGVHILGQKEVTLSS